jgi:broad specificity phosphatase PhoE
VSHLILIKHSLPALDPAAPAPEWCLSEEGRRRAELLARRLEGLAPAVIASSPEPKAIATASLLGAHHHLPVQVVGDLREHERRRTAYLGDQAFQDAVIAALRHPDELVLGEETTGAARHRFTAAVTGLLTTTPPERTLALVTHGTVLALYVAAATGVDVVALWRRLGLPSYVVLSRPYLALIEIVDTIV